MFVYRVTRLAALMHDLGHGPLSHTFDGFAPTREALKTVLDDPDLQAIMPLREFMLSWGTDTTKASTHTKNRRIPHEIMSCVFFTKIWHDVAGDPALVPAVCAAILGAHNGEDCAALLESPLARTWVPLIHDVVASAPADADRMDYMERDSRAIGVTYGLFDRNRILKSLLCYRDHSADRIRYRLGVKESGLKAIENLMQARYELFAQIYYHKTNRSISRMLDEISNIAESKMDLFGGPATLDGWMAIYLDLSDERLLRLLLGKDGSTAPPRIRSLAESIKNRELWKRILDPTTKDEADYVLSVLRSEFGDVSDFIKRDDTKPKALKDLDSGAALLIRSGVGAYEVGKAGRWTEESTIIDALEYADETFVRIYFDSDDFAKAKEIRARALDLVFQQKGAPSVAS